MPQVSDIVIIVTSLFKIVTRVEDHQDCKDLLLVNLTPDNNRKKKNFDPIMQYNRNSFRSSQGEDKD